MREGQRGQEERGDTGRDNKWKESQSERQRKKRGKTKRMWGRKSWTSETRAAIQSRWAPLDLLVPRNCSETHTPVFEASLAPHAWMDQADCWHWVCGGSIFRFWLRLSKPCRSLDLCVSRASQSLWPVTTLPKLELICGIQYAFLSWLSGMQVCRVQDQSMHRTQAHCSVSPGDNPHFSCQAGFHSYFTS